MALYTGNHCPICNKAFTDTDDVVVCPECGTPYHRACWQKVGACIHADEHAAGFEWKPDKDPAPAEAEDEQICPNCGAHNAAGARFCDHCGTPLSAYPHPGQKASVQTGPVYTRPQAPDSAGASGSGSAAGAARQAEQQDGFSGFFRRELGPNDDVAGIKAKDWATYLGPSSLSYLAQFVRMEERKRKTSVSLAALVFGPVYFFYRKMWKIGAIFTAIELLLSLPSFLSVMQMAGSPLVAGLDLGWLLPASWVCTVLSWVQMVLRSLFAFYWYRQDAARCIRDICARYPEGQQRSDALVLRGGTSVVAVILFFVGLVAFSMLFYWLMGPNRTAAVNAIMRAYMM